MCSRNIGNKNVSSSIDRTPVYVHFGCSAMWPLRYGLSATFMIHTTHSGLTNAHCFISALTTVPNAPAVTHRHVPNIKVKWSRYWPSVAQRVGRGIALFFHDRGIRRGWVVSSTPRPHFTPGKDQVPVLQYQMYSHIHTSMYQKYSHIHTSMYQMYSHVHTSMYQKYSHIHTSSHPPACTKSTVTYIC